MDVLLVLGDVTDEQYEPLQRAMLDAGLNPHVVQVPEEYAHSFLFMDEKMDGLLGYGRSQSEIAEDKRIEQLMANVLSELFGEATISDVKAVIQASPPADDLHSDTRWSWLLDQIPPDRVAEYTVRPGEDGGFWLHGRGCGSLQVAS